MNGLIHPTGFQSLRIDPESRREATLIP